MPICNICGKELKNPSSSSHINSKYHQEALIRHSKKSGLISTEPKSFLPSNLETEFITLKNKVLDLEKKVNRIENHIKFNNYMSRPLEEKDVSLKNREQKIIERDILETASKQTSFNYTSGNIVLKDLKVYLQKKYSLNTNEFEEIIMRLYRKQKIDLQPGGNPYDYHLLSPTGKKFYYLLIKS